MNKTACSLGVGAALVGALLTPGTAHASWQSAHQGIHVVWHNQTYCDLRLTDGEVSEGLWDEIPPLGILARSDAIFSAESVSADAGGSVGTIAYTSEDCDNPLHDNLQLRFNWEYLESGEVSQDFTGTAPSFNTFFTGGGQSSRVVHAFFQEL
ncbi:hypothetical protein [Allostreptomyces psammosilenae]|uniref:Avidin family protein n=1 Tax=Allostreptomyces psammosilenae TaxID=1892865 RepID=A0A853A924_9ACTN|nr:hypothetical protein [Allostreptomyces psammosilenae]NYI06922.1 hypothetical protein [Allostreptomyces psammosilenae]